MGCLIVAGINFYMLAEGESYPTPNIGNNYSVSYVVFPYEGKWVAQKLRKGVRWIDITDKRFDTENEAFNFTYEYAFTHKDRHNF